MHRNYKTAQHATECDDSGCVVGNPEVGHEIVAKFQVRRHA